MPAYNHERFVRQAVESVWDQEFRDLELIAVDDGSADATGDILRELAARSPIPMKVISQSNAGVSAALNRALETASGEWIAFLASDDFYDRRFLKVNVDAMRSSEGRAVVQHCDSFLVGASGSIIGRLGETRSASPAIGTAFEQILESSAWIVPGSLFVSAELLRSIGGFDETMRTEDYDLQLRLARAATFQWHREPLYYSRYTPSSLGKSPWVWDTDIIRSIEKHRDFLGERYEDVLRDRTLEIANASFEHGAWRRGLYWVREGIARSAGLRQVAGVCFTGLTLAGRAAARRTAIRAFGRERLVRLKHTIRNRAG